MKQQYKDIKFRASTLEMIATINKIVDDYEDQGYVLSVRQIYYRLVADNIITNHIRSYKYLTNLVNDGKVAGLIDWSMFEDRSRAFKGLNRFSSPGSYIRTTPRWYHRDMWENQDSRVFCIVEKDALFGVLSRPCNAYDIPLLAAKGYPSGTVLREFAQEIVDSGFSHQNIVILHLGDHDPSGIDMTRDLRERVTMFADGEFNFDIHRIALNMPQIKEMQPPENPTKMADSRTADYVRKFGRSCWELDAIEPKALDALLQSHISKYIDNDLWEERELQIEEEREKIAKHANKFKG